MDSHLCLSIRLLNHTFHGRRDGAKPEWPPSPMRVFQSLVSAATACSDAKNLSPRIRSMLEWLEQQPPPVLIAPSAVSGSGYRLSVPNNAMDIVAKAWCRGNYTNSGDANPSTHRTMKPVLPTLLLDDTAVHYLWPLCSPLPDDVREHVHSLEEIARSVVVVGWGIDLAIGHCTIMSTEQLNALSGERWLPNLRSGAIGVRTPTSGTLHDLLQRHEQFSSRIRASGLRATLPLCVYRTVVYQPSTRRPSGSVAAFSILKLDASGFRPFDAARHGLTVAGMMRHTVKYAAVQSGWSESDINTLIMGHAESTGGEIHVPVGSARFAYLPLPSIEIRGEGNAQVVGSVRRVMLSSFAAGFEDKISWAQLNLSGQELIEEKLARPVALLSLLPKSDKMVQRYLRPAISWATVTPVVLPGYDDPNHYRRRLADRLTADRQRSLLKRLSDRIDGLLRKAIIQAGFPQMLANNAELEWRFTGFWPGSDLANRYGVPPHLKRYARLHVRLGWRDSSKRPIEVPGPVCLGGGRFYGIGLFAAQ
ncbi:MAG: type I-G CRISPR-associated protein Csb2 [Terriglobia bacterium]